MAVNRAEATNLARKCLPQMRQRDKSIPEGLENTLTEKDVKIKNICRLWAGMGYIYEVTIQNKHQLIIKRINLPNKSNMSFGDKRKAVSYEVESNFYNGVAHRLISEHDLCIPVPYHVERSDDSGDEIITICMSRLDGSPGSLSSEEEIHAVLKWLACLHAATWGKRADELVSGINENSEVEKELGPSEMPGVPGLQPIGSYWHLQTRPHEHDSMPRRGWEGRLKKAACAIDERLRRDDMQCCIHGDAKDANMLFFRAGGELKVAMYDFQYCGKAPPTVDLAYFLCVAACCGGGREDYLEYLNFYHEELVSRLDQSDGKPSLKQFDESLQLAFCDFQRFMSGWGMWGSDISSVVIQVLDRLDGGRDLGSEDAYREAVLREFG